MDIEFIGDEIPKPARSSYSETILEQLKENPGQWARIASEDEDTSATTVRAKGTSLQQYARRHEIINRVDVAERTIDGKLNVFARWNGGKK